MGETLGDPTPKEIVRGIYDNIYLQLVPPTTTTTTLTVLGPDGFATGKNEKL